MATSSFHSCFELFRAAPAKCLLLAGGPFVLACGQLLNSYVNGLSPLVAIGFAAGMVAFGVVATRHHAAELRLEALESDLERNSRSGAYADSSD